LILKFKNKYNHFALFGNPVLTIIGSALSAINGPNYYCKISNLFLNF
jgi:hypothetical protein